MEMIEVRKTTSLLGAQGGRFNRRAQGCSVCGIGIYQRLDGGKVLRASTAQATPRDALLYKQQDITAGQYIPRICLRQTAGTNQSQPWMSTYPQDTFCHCEHFQTWRFCTGRTFTVYHKGWCWHDSSSTWWSTISMPAASSSLSSSLA